MRDDFAYYGDIVREPELDSCLLADHDGTGMTEAEYIHSVKKEAALAAASFCMEREWDMIELAKSVLMLVLSKYTGHTASLAAVSGRRKIAGCMMRFPLKSFGRNSDGVLFLILRVKPDSMIPSRWGIIRTARRSLGSAL